MAPLKSTFRACPGCGQAVADDEQHACAYTAARRAYWCPHCGMQDGTHMADCPHKVAMPKEMAPCTDPGCEACRPAPINRHDYGPHTGKLSTDKTERKESPIARGALDYFPDALAEVAHVSFVGNQQHNPGQEMHWAKEKSTDHADCILRHLIERGTVDTDKLRHSAKLAWRALALLQVEIEAERKAAAVKPDLSRVDESKYPT